MRSLLLAFAFSVVSTTVQSNDWSCSAKMRSFNNGEWCDVEKTEYNAKQADKRLNEIYRKLLTDYVGKDRQPWVVAQRAWIKFAEAHCSAVSEKGAGAASTRQYVYQTCRAEQIIERTKVLESYCESCR